MNYIAPYLTAVVIFLAIDFAWLKAMSKSFYRPEIGHLMADTPNLAAAGVFYLLYVLAACILVIYPALKKDKPDSLLPVFLLGAVLGAAAYGTYDFTSLAVFKDFTLKVAIVDTLWGALLTGSVCTVTVRLINKF